ncbi:MAG: UDP-N-acetylmuramate dehydrogenase [Bacteroidota bacterium]
MTIQENVSLKPFNTFGIDVQAKHFATVKGLVQLQKLLQLSSYPEHFILGGGSNLLLTRDIDALVLHLDLKGITTIAETEDTITIKAMAGENWHELVLWTLDKGYGGLENLSLIPGNVGTAPIQNIGAYGVELKDVFVSCEAMAVSDQELVAFTAAECDFGYRDSIFKKALKGKYIIVSVTFTLTKVNHRLQTLYGAIEEELVSLAVTEPTIRDVSNAVIRIRSKKLPDPKVIGNSGSFFKNPVVSKKTFQNFHKKHADAPFYTLEDGNYKIPAGWLIEQCGFKGKRFGKAGVHDKQALVLVNHGGATGKEILELSQQIQEKVQAQFGIRIYPEVNII